MKKYLTGLALMLVTGMALASVTTNQKYILNNQAGSAAQKTQLGTLMDQAGGHLSVVWNASTGNMYSSTKVDGVPAPATPGMHYLGVNIPAKSLIRRAWIEVTQPGRATGVGFSPGISFYCSTEAVGGSLTLGSSTLVTDGVPGGQGAAISGGTLVALTAIDTLATFQRNDSTTDCRVSARVEGKDITTGKITLFVNYEQIR